MYKNMIYTITRNGNPFFEHEIRGSRVRSAPAVDYVDIEFDYFEAILLKRNDEIVFKGQTYYCDNQYNSEFKESSNLYKHRARFVSENYRATEIALLDSNGVSVYEIEGNLLTLLTLAVSNLNRVSSGWSYDPVVPNTVTKLFQISGENVMGFLTKVSGEFEIPFEINNKVVRFGNAIHNNGGNFEYGKGKGFLDLKKSYRSGEKIANTIYASGGEGLELDEPVISQDDIDKNGVIEGFYSNDRIIPTTRASVVGNVTQNNILATNISYNLNDYKILGQTPIINFETGGLAGLSFYITKFDFNEDNVELIYFKKRTVDGIEYPNDDVKPQNGDYFNITGIRQPEQLILDAKEKLRSEATLFLMNGINKNLIIDASLDSLYAENLQLNNRIKIVDNDLNIDGIFIINEIKEDFQNLQKKEITLDYLGRKFTKFKLEPVNDNLIQLGIDNNYDYLVELEQEFQQSDKFNIKSNIGNVLTPNFSLLLGENTYNFDLSGSFSSFKGSKNNFEISENTISLGKTQITTDPDVVSLIELPKVGDVKKTLPVEIDFNGEKKIANANGTIEIESKEYTTELIIDTGERGYYLSKNETTYISKGMSNYFTFLVQGGEVQKLNVQASVETSIGFKLNKDMVVDGQIFTQRSIFELGANETLSVTYDAIRDEFVGSSSNNKANIRLDNIVSDLTPTEQMAIKTKLGITSDEPSGGSKMFIEQTTTDQMINLKATNNFIRSNSSLTSLRIRAQNIENETCKVFNAGGGLLLVKAVNQTGQSMQVENTVDRSIVIEFSLPAKSYALLERYDAGKFLLTIVKMESNG